MSLPGAIVADITHLLAELVENATNFSDPSSTVELSSYRMREGLMVQITDHGIGIGSSDLALHNERISMPPRLDEAPSRLLGLFVVGRLADRHDLRVVLDSEPGAGTTAHVLIPGELVIEPEEDVVAHEPMAHADNPSTAPAVASVVPDAPVAPPIPSPVPPTPPTQPLLPAAPCLLYTSDAADD